MYLKKLVSYTGLICILLGLSTSIAYQTSSLAPMVEDNRRTFQAFSKGVEKYREFKVAWRPRIITNFLAAKVAQLGNLNLRHTIAVWSALWFFLIGMLYVFAAKRKSIFYLFGTFAAILFAYTPNLQRVFPWDLPSIFVFTAFTILYARKQYWLILLLLPFGMGLKETTILLPLGFLLSELPWKRKIFFFLLSLVICVGTKTAIDLYVQAPLPFFTMEYSFTKDDLGDSYLLYNFNKLVSLNFIPLLINGGTLLAFLFLPSLNKTARAFKVIGFTLFGFLLLFGLINEYRIFFELIPLALYSLALYFYGDSFLLARQSNGMNS